MTQLNSREPFGAIVEVVLILIERVIKVAIQESTLGNAYMQQRDQVGSIRREALETVPKPLDEPFKLGHQVLDLPAEFTIATGKRTKCVLGSRCGTVQTTRAEPAASFGESAGRETIEPFAKLNRSCDDKSLHLVDGLGTSLYSRVLGAP